MADDPRPDFTHPLPLLATTTTDGPTDLPAADQAEVDRRCDELRHHRDQAAVTGGSYLIGGGSDG